MNPPTTPVPDTPSFNALSTPTPAARGRPRGALTGTGAKRGRKPRGAATGVGTTTPRISPQDSRVGAASPFPTSQFSHVHWAMPGQTQTSSSGGAAASGSVAGTGTAAGTSSTSTAYASTTVNPQGQQAQASSSTFSAASAASSAPGTASSNFAVPRAGSGAAVPSLDTSGLISLSGAAASGMPVGAGSVGTGAVPLVRPPGMGDDEGDGDDEMLPAMADDDYSAQLSWQSQSKDNLKVLMDNFSPAQYERFEAYRRHALPKQAVRKVIQQTIGQQVSQPVAQIVAGFAKVFVGEIVEKARAVQTRRGETGPLSPDHLREAYRIYQAETGRVGAARPLRSKRLFVR
ncbi:putative hTAFII28-like protein conserved region [Lyophyllum shimeji]|uniref:Transcription initiation factor TFIID subunit 11 n=1 Tax=Lyophyllum shimeji TaxID=47721 RepID=A0A9P3UVF2_LYOSH|nr:putative hTAFII28-like protein conserved region [Lyophyllum shimeji]